MLFLAMAAAFLASSSEPIFAKWGYLRGATAWQLLSVKYPVALAVLLLLFRGRYRLGLREMKKIFGAGALLFATNALTLASVERIPASWAVVLLAMTPALVALINKTLHGETLPSRFWPGLGLCWLGTILTTRLERLSAANAAGIALIFGALFLSSVYRVQLERLTRAHAPISVSAHTLALAALFSAALAPAASRPFPFCVWPLGLWMGAVAALANAAFVYALSMVGSTRISVYLLLERPLVLLAAVLALGESLGPLQWAGTALIFLGVYLAKETLRPKAVLA